VINFDLNKLGLGDMSNQKDPFLALMQVSINSQQGMLNLQGANNNLLQDYTDAFNSSNKSAMELLDQDCNVISNTAISQTALTQAQVKFQADQTQVSNSQNQFSTLVQGKSTILTAETQDGQQLITFIQSVASVNDNTVNAISSFFSG